MIKILSLALTLLPSGITNVPKEKVVKLIKYGLLFASVWFITDKVINHLETKQEYDIEVKKLDIQKAREENNRLKRELTDLNKKLLAEKEIRRQLSKSAMELAVREKELHARLKDGHKALAAANKKLEILQGNLTNDAINNPDDNIRSTNDYIFARLQEYERITAGTTSNN